MKHTETSRIDLDEKQLLGFKTSGAQQKPKVGTKKRPAKVISRNGAKVGGKVTT